MALSLFKKPEKVISRESLARIPSEYSASEIRSGFLVAVSVIVLLSLLFMAGNYQFFRETYQVRILFDYISGLAKNAPVHFAGHQVGKVTHIRLVRESEAKVVITVSILKDAVLKKDSEAFIDVLGFMGEKFVEITPGTPEAPTLEEGGEIRGTDPIAMSEIMKKGTEVADELQKTTVSLQHVIRNVNATIGENRRELEMIFKNLEESSKNLKEMTADLKAHPWKLLRKGKEKKPDGKKKRRFLFF